MFEKLAEDGWVDVARAIVTTDTTIKISSKEILKSASIFLFSPDILRIHFCNKKIGITSIGAPIKAMTVHFQSTYNATAIKETRAIPSFITVINI